jgi:ABC-type lipoprotein export system ATPase subunit
MAGPAILCENLVKIYKVEDLEVVALQGLDLEVRSGELMAIIGPSGSGKTSLLNVLGGLDTPSAGRAWVAGTDLVKMTHRQSVLHRKQTVGFVWQNVGRNLIPYLTALENVTMPMMLAGRVQRSRARDLLELVGLGHRASHRPRALSGGEQQRVAVAIALANDPPVLLADEPTGSLDRTNGRHLLEVFDNVRRSLGTTILIVTHDTEMAKTVDRYVEIRDGKTSREAVRRAAAPAQDSREEPETHDHYTLLDSAGRLQVPEELLARYRIGRRVRLTEAEEGIFISAPEEPGVGGKKQGGSG